MKTYRNQGMMQHSLKKKGHGRRSILAATHPVKYISVSITKSTRNNVKKKIYLRIIGLSHIQFGRQGKNPESPERITNNQHWTQL